MVRTNVTKLFFPCFFFLTPNNIFTPGALKIDFFGIPGDSLGSYKEAFTLQCEINGNSWSKNCHYIGIGQKNKDGTFDILDTGNHPIMKLRFKDVRCKHPQEFICEVRSLGVVKICKTFVAAQRECKFFICEKHTLLIDINDS